MMPELIRKVVCPYFNFGMLQTDRYSLKFQLLGQLFTKPMCRSYILELFFGNIHRIFTSLYLLWSYVKMLETLFFQAKVTIVVVHNNLHAQIHFRMFSCFLTVNFKLFLSSSSLPLHQTYFKTGGSKFEGANF